MSFWPTLPANVEPFDVTPIEEVLLHTAADSRGVAYNTGVRGDRTRANVYERMDRALLVVFTNAAAGGWDRGMWAAHLTALGWNALFRFHATDIDGTIRDRHVGRIDIYGHHTRPCEGYWHPDGTCDSCGAVRPLDAAAYRDYLDTLSDEARANEESGPRLWCPEHGRMRRRDITTTKVCRLPGTDFHDGGLNRL